MADLPASPPGSLAAIQFGFVAVQLGRFAEQTGDRPDEPADDEALAYESSAGLRFDEGTRRIDILTTVSVRDPADPEDALPLAEAEAVCTFELASVDSVRDEAGQVRIPRAFLAHLVGMAFSTVRGVLAGRARHPVFRRAPLPVMSPITFVDDLVQGDDFAWVDPTPAVPAP